ncbi:MAG TPA: SDR family oxidoreductase [Kouleothrix sp.]|nr:SDR family oxidoreductase [Kouleothrix sp.]
MQQLLITGGAGYLGSELARQASARGWDVAATYLSTHPPLAQVHWHQLDLRDSAATASLVTKLRPAVIIHTAYRQNGPDLWAATVQGTEHVAHAAQTAGVRLVHISSDALFDGELAPGQYYTAADPPSPISPYGKAKAAAEHAVETILPDALVVRTSLLYGGAQPGTHEQLVLDVLAGSTNLAFFTDELRCPIAVDDLAAGLLELVAAEQRGRLHLAGPTVMSRYEFACAVATAHGYDPGSLQSASSESSGVRRPRNCAMDSRPTYALLRTHIRNIAEVLGNHNQEAPHDTH